MPLLIYGAELDNEDEEITIDNFAEKIDPRSWEEFMPKGVSKQKFNAFKKYYDPDIFRAAGKRIRAMAKAADKLSVEERIGRITDIFSTFRNPDKETVLTPWRVVNMHLGDCLGGYCFYDKEYENTIDEPRFIDHGKVTEEVFMPDSRILEINSKSGLYPLYMAYSIYRSRLKDSTISADTLEEQQAVWDKTVAENIFVVCKTPMAKSITKRTLIGFRKAKVNTRYFEDLINQIKNKPQNFIEKMAKGRSFWKANDDDNMKFNAIVGNPPYQVMDGGAGASAKPVYHLFVDIAKKLKAKYISMIMPARWYAGGKGLDEFRDDMLKDKSISLLVDYFDATDVFPRIDISGGICYFLYDRNCRGNCKVITSRQGKRNELVRPLLEKGNNTFIRFNEAISILRKVSVSEDINFSNLVSPRKPFGIVTDVQVSKLQTASMIRIYAYPDNGFIERIAVKTNSEWIDYYKVYISYAYGERGDFPYFVIGKPFLGEPKTCCSETYLVIAPNKREQYCMNVIKYLKTMFLRFFVLLKKNTQHATSKVYSFVPLQNFTEASDIDWSKSIPEIDQQLYLKYHLTDEEIAFIGKMIKPM